MKETPIIFQGWKVRKMLEWDWDTSTMQTRRVIKKQPLDIHPLNSPDLWVTLQTKEPEPHGDLIMCRFGEPGDLLWVRESLSVEVGATKSEIECGKFTYKADDQDGLWTKENGFRTISPIHMQKWQARIWLEIVNVKVERVQDITREDAIKEGVKSIWHWTPDRKPEHFNRGILNPYVANYCVVWDEINAGRGLGWEFNPWVWALEFKRRKS